MSREAIEKWLSEEKAILEKEDAYLGYWFHSGTSNGFGVALTGVYSGEYHVTNQGKVSMYVDDGPETIIFQSESQASTDRDVKNLYENFKKRILDEST